MYYPLMFCSSSDVYKTFFNQEEPKPEGQKEVEICLFEDKDGERRQREHIRGF